MKELLKGRAWKFGHDLDRDAHIFPFQYVLESNGVPLERLAHHVMEPVNPAFGVKVRKGDFLVVGRNFGHGKGHPEGIACLKMLGIAAVIADSFINLFVKDAVYFGLPMLDGEGIYDRINQDDELEVDATASEIGDSVHRAGPEGAACHRGRAPSVPHHGGRRAGRVCKEKARTHERIRNEPQRLEKVNGEVTRMDRKMQIRTVVACILGNSFENFDFIIFSMFSVIIAKTFFPAKNEMTSLLLALGTFGVGYFIRPIGGLLLGVYADKKGRRSALALISIMMGIATGIIALTPGYLAIGLAAPILIVLARMTQGFSAGGEFGSATAMLMEYAPPRKRAFYTSWQMASQVAMVAAGSLIVFALTQGLSRPSLESWGWRSVFLFGVLIGPIGYYIRTRLAESPEFQRYLNTEGGPARSPVRVVFSKYPVEMICSAGLVLIGTSSFYLNMIYLMIFAMRQLKLAMATAMLSLTISCAIQFVICLMSARLADRFGRVKVLLPAAIAWVILAYPLFSWLIAHPTPMGLILVQGSFSIIVGFLSGPMPLMLTEIFPVHIRSTGVSLVYNVIAAAFGGLTPFTVTWLISVTHDNASPAYYAACTGIVGAVAIFFLSARQKSREESFR